jgi:hypothetical protein
MQRNNPGRIVDTGQIVADYACFYPGFGLYYAIYCEIASKMSLLDSGEAKLVS